MGKTFNALSDGIQASDFALPPVPNLGFQIDIPDIPEAILSFQFDDLELYVQLNTVFSGDVTYNLNLYTSKTPIGLSIGDEVTAGVVFTVDLILSAGAEVDISSGFHIKLDDGVAFDIALFGQNVTDTTL